jgi:hypothetical protein
MWRVSRRNCHGRKLRSLLPKTAPKSIFRKTRFLFVFTKPPPHLFSGQNRQCGAFQGEIGMDEFARFCLKRPQNLFFFFFQKTRFRFVFMKPPLTYFRGHTDLCRTFRGKIIMDENFARFCLNRPQNGFSEKHVSGPFLRNRPSPIFRAKRTI